MVTYCIQNDFHQERSWIFDLTDTTEGIECSQAGLLRQIFIE
jgi:hypothetical protein